MIGDRQRHRDLAIVLLAELAAILPRHADRMPALLGKAGVVDDPGLDRPVPLDLPAAPARAPWPAPSRPTRAPRRQNAAAIDAAPPPAPAPSPPPSARRSCARPASAAPRNNPAAARPGRHGRSRSQAPRHRPKTAIHCSPSEDPSQPSHAEKRISSKYASLYTTSPRLSDSVRLAELVLKRFERGRSPGTAARRTVR